MNLVYSPVEQVDDVRAVFCIFFGMGDLDNGYFVFRIEFLEQIHDFFSLFGIQVPCWLIGEDELGFCDQGTCNANQLLLQAEAQTAETMTPATTPATAYS